jgi:hypothetical protein
MMRRRTTTGSSMPPCTCSRERNRPILRPSSSPSSLFVLFGRQVVRIVTWGDLGKKGGALLREHKKKILARYHNMTDSKRGHWLF